MSLQQIIEYDKELFFWLNGGDSLFWDGVMKVITSTTFWIPMYVVLAYVLIKNNSVKGFLLTLLAIVMTVLLCDQIASGFCKPYFERFRPTQDPYLMYLVDIVDGFRGGRFGFMSSHACNTFGIFMFLTLLLRNTSISFLLFIWAVINSYSRIYLGVHYPSDILCGCVMGCIVALIVYTIYSIILRKYVYVSRDFHRVSAVYTKSGYLMSDIGVLNLVFLITYSIIPIIALFRLFYI